MTPSRDNISVLYRFCAQSLQYPSDLWFTHDYLESFYTLLNTLGADQERMNIEAKLGSDSDPLEQLQIEYTRLFINAVPHVIAPPYGSVYIDKSLQGPFTEKVLTFYREAGFSLKENSDLPDHLALQLEFLSLLNDKGQQEVEGEFLQKLFRPWFSKFHARIVEEATHPFYITLIEFIDYLTKEDDEHGIQFDEA